MTIFNTPACLQFLFIIHSVNSDSDVLENMLAKIEQDTYAFAGQVEELILDKCNVTSVASCDRKSYHVCNSELPYATCPGKDLNVKACGSGVEGGCGGLFDFTTSIVSVAPDSSTSTERTDNRIKDGVCSTLLVEQYMKDTTAADTAYWEKFDVIPPSLYYGTDDG